MAKQRMTMPTRFQYKGTYKGEPKRPSRPGSEQLDNAPSRYGNMYHYPDGRREKIQEQS